MLSACLMKCTVSSNGEKILDLLQNRLNILDEFQIRSFSTTSSYPYQRELYTHTQKLSVHSYRFQKEKQMLIKRLSSLNSWLTLILIIGGTSKNFSFHSSGHFRCLYYIKRNTLYRSSISFRRIDQALIQ